MSAFAETLVLGLGLGTLILLVALSRGRRRS